uniref:Putative glycosyl transferase n=1 Tax=uncultured bacterium contig00031 TaxID=1181520 RepID=A0A806K098_9BACT|nr:putative glycosyl transferase [uncultured bacterium contig00031]
MKQGIVIPIYRHAIPARLLAEKLVSFGIPIILVDDGNDSESKKCLEECAAQIPGTFLVRLEKNLGKGGAVVKGLEKAAELGLTHVLQIDADGQHDIGMVPFFMEESAKHPDNVICGYPQFNETAPKGRVIGRKISCFWTVVVTFTKDFIDVLCGFRVYPVDAVLRITKKSFIDKRMGFDPEILVRLYWNRVFPVYHPIKVIYPECGISNFHMFRDNLRISWMFTRLFFGMLIRLPLLVSMKRRKENK